jgi:hypothetical protein
MTIDNRIITGAHISARDLPSVIELARQRWQDVPRFHSVEVWLGRARLYPPAARETPTGRSERVHQKTRGDSNGPASKPNDEPDGQPRSELRHTPVTEASASRQPAPEQPDIGAPMSSHAFWDLVDQLRIPDAEALELIGYSGETGPAGARPQFPLSTPQTRLASYLPEIAAALRAIDELPAWLRLHNSASAPVDRTPELLPQRTTEDDVADVLRLLIRLWLRKALR